MWHAAVVRQFTECSVSSHPIPPKTHIARFDFDVCPKEADDCQTGILLNVASIVFRRTLVWHSTIRVRLRFTSQCFVSRVLFTSCSGHAQPLQLGQRRLTLLKCRVPELSWQDVAGTGAARCFRFALYPGRSRRPHKPALVGAWPQRAGCP